MASGKSNGNRSRNHSHDNMGCASVGGSPRLYFISGSKSRSRCGSGSDSGSGHGS